MYFFMTAGSRDLNSAQWATSTFLGYIVSWGFPVTYSYKSNKNTSKDVLS